MTRIINPHDANMVKNTILHGIDAKVEKLPNPFPLGTSPFLVTLEPISGLTIKVYLHISEPELREPSKQSMREIRKSFEHNVSKALYKCLVIKQEYRWSKLPIIITIGNP